MEHGVHVGEGIVARVVAERPFEPPLAWVHVAFEDKFGVGGNLQVHGFALCEPDPRLPQKSREQELVRSPRKRGGGGVYRRRIGAYRHRDLHAPAEFFVFPEKVRTVLVDVPVHSRRVFVVDLQAVHPEVAHFAVRGLREDERQRDEPPSVFRPAFEHGDFRQVNIVPELCDFLAGGRSGNGFREYF